MKKPSKKSRIGKNVSIGAVVCMLSFIFAVWRIQPCIDWQDVSCLFLFGIAAILPNTGKD